MSRNVLHRLMGHPLQSHPTSSAGSTPSGSRNPSPSPFSGPSPKPSSSLSTEPERSTPGSPTTSEPPVPSATSGPQAAEPSTPPVGGTGPAAPSAIPATSPSAPPAQPSSPSSPQLVESVTLSYHAALHLRTICMEAPYEVMFLGVTRDPSRPFYVTDLYMPLQTNSGAFCNPTAQGMQEAMWFAEDNHLQPWQVLSIWIHTHPHMSAHPSGTDESTFRDYFLDKHTSAMCILSKTGDTYARIQVSNSRAILTKEVPFVLPATLTREDPISKPWYDLLASQTKEDSPYRTSFQSSGGSGSMEYDEVLQQWVMEEEGPGKVQVQEVQVPPTQGTAKALNLLAKDSSTSHPVTRSTNLWTSKKDGAPAHIELSDKSLEKLAWSIAHAHRQNAPESHPAFARFRALPYIDKQIVEGRLDNIKKVWEYWNSK